MNKKFSRSFAFLMIGILITMTACARLTGTQPSHTPVSAVSAKVAFACDLPACASLVVTQDGQPGMSQAAASFARPADMAESPWKIDTGTPSPDGNWVAYTSISSESGGPVFLQNVKSGEWTNLIEAANAQLPKDQPAFAQDYGWDVIGWFPKSDRLMIGPGDLSLVVVVDLASFNSQSIPFPGGGRGGKMFVDLAPDGGSFVFIGDDAEGNQVMSTLDLANGQVNELLHMPYEQGALSNPRFSPNQSNLAYIQQTGQPDPGLTYSIELLSTQTGQTSQLVEDTQTMTVPMWSPDGSKIAYVRGEEKLSPPSAKETTLQSERTNIWIVGLDGQQTQASFGDGYVRSPAWANDNQTLAYVMENGQVDLVSLAQPGVSWQAAGSSAVPELTNVFFLP